MANTKSKKFIYIVDIALLIIVAIVLGVSMKWSYDIELKLGLLYYTDVNSVDEADIVRPRNSGVYISADGDGSDTGSDVGAAADEVGLYIHYVNVGQGDCTIIEFPDNKTMIIDGGENKKTTETAIQTFIDNTLPSDFTYFDYAILTHPDSDHCGSLDYVLNKYPARVAYRPNVEAIGTSSNKYTDPGKAELNDAVTKNTAAYAESIKAMYKEAADFTPTVYVTDPSDEAQTITGGADDNTYTFTFFSPLSQSYGDWNDYSPIMILSYRGYNFALSGDAEKKNEAEFVAKVQSAATDGVTDKYDIFTDSYTVNAIKCGHHGSRTSTSQDYIDAITTPEGARAAYYIISCGKGNSYKHPHPETLNRLAAMGVPEENILRTDLLGDITLSVRLDVGDEETGTGEYMLFYGNKVTKIPESVLVYRTLGGIKLKWAIVAWSCYAVFIVIAICHMIYVSVHSGGANGGGNNGGASSASGARKNSGRGGKR